MNASCPPVLPRVFRCCALLLAVAGLVSACSDDDGGFKPAVQGGDQASTEEPGSKAASPAAKAPEQGGLDAKRAEEVDADAAKESDIAARGLLESFKARVYDPDRDSHLLSVSAVASVEFEGTSATFRVSYDGAVEDANARISVLPLEGVDAMPANTLKQVRRFASFGLQGAYPSVVYHSPPIAYWLTLTEKEPRDYVVTAPEFNSDLSVSYQFDKRQVIVTRGALFGGKKEISKFTYEDYRGRYLVKERLTVGTGTRVEYEYREDDGMVLLIGAKLHQKGKTLTTSFDYSDLRRKTP